LRGMSGIFHISVNIGTYNLRGAPQFVLGLLNSRKYCIELMNSYLYSIFPLVKPSCPVVARRAKSEAYSYGVKSRLDSKTKLNRSATCRKGHLVQLVSLASVLKFEIPLNRLSDLGRDFVRGLLHLGQRGSVSLSPRNTTALKRWSQFPHLYSMVGMKASPNDLF
jgi:hypothetical protein